MKWHLIRDGFQTGRINMQTDIRLARECNPDDAWLRIYRWKPYCISLGANQSYDDIDIGLAAADGLEVTKRPTGGRAILHSEEITYSVIYPGESLSSAKQLYSEISNALLKGLSIYDSTLTDAELEDYQPNFPDLLKEPSGVLCFASAAKSEVKFSGRKLIGSAQRRIDKNILQHGSILCGTFHRKLPYYLRSDENTKNSLSAELSEKTIEIETILQKKVNYNYLTDCIIEGFSQYWGINFVDINQESKNYER
ncbi:MAG: hypothetical protein K9I71_02000 [Ignavibacteriales bacterium]|nr:hypothetical protein [Ignavibacteriales bacterium]MCF8314862.1 hypothetical protein [Ignavibacteriales bacterium]MCF8436189.1 hypothetical protein [Ignavibacteriales bacterium]